MNYTSDEKIDYIFKELRAQKRSRLTKQIFKGIIIFILIFIYMNFIYPINKVELSEKISWIIWDIVKPITKDLIKDIMSDNETNPQALSESLINELKKNPDLINKLK